MASKSSSAAEAASPELEVLAEQQAPRPAPPLDTNSRLFYDIENTVNVDPERFKHLKSALISREAMKRPELMRSGMALLPEGPLLGEGQVAPTLDECDPVEVLKTVSDWVEKNLNDEQKELIKSAGVLENFHTKKAAKAAATEKKRNLEVAAGDSEDDEDGYLTFDWNCDQVRRKINTFIESGEMKVTQFQKEIGANSKSYGSFMKMKGPMKGIDNSTMSGAYRFFKKREKEGKAMPKKRKTAAAQTIDLSEIHLEGEEEDAVEVFDSCDEIRRKISAHLRKPGVIQAQLLKDLAAQFKTRDVKLQSKQLNDFRGKKGADAGNTSAIFYSAYVFFEKLRIKEGKPKNKHRLEMEKIWGPRGGFDIKHASHNRGVWVMKGEVPVMDQYGQISIH